MRPKKIIFLFCRDAERRSVLAFMLETRGYRVIVGISAPVADVGLFIDDDAHEAEDAAMLAYRFHPELPRIVMVKGARRERSYYPGYVLKVSDKLPMIELLEHIRWMTTRKCGPRRPAPRRTVASILAGEF